MSKGRSPGGPPRPPQLQPVLATPGGGGARQNAADQIFQRGMALHQAGRLQEAEPLYRETLRAQPAHFDALHMLGVLHAQCGDAAGAVALISEALKVGPKSSVAFNNRGNALKELGRFAEALASYDQAIVLNKKSPSAFNNRGAVLKELGRYEDALASYDKAIRLKPDYAEAINNRGAVLQALERYDDALKSCDRAIALMPNHASLHFNRASALEALGRWQDALTGYDRAIQLKPDYAEAYNNRGAVLRELGELDEALRSYDRALQLNPNFAEALNNRASLLLRLDKLDEALKSCDQAVLLKPDFAEAYHNRGEALHRLRRHEDAIASYDKAIALQPDHTASLIRRGDILQHLTRPDEAYASYERAVELDGDATVAACSSFVVATLLCDWRNRERKRDNLIRHVIAGDVIYPFAMLTISDNPEEQLSAAQIQAKAIAAGITPLARLRASPRPHIRVAYISGDFRDHAVSRVTIDLFEHHDRAKFETFGISLGPSDGSPLRKRIEAAFDRFLDVSARSEEEIAKLIAVMDIDIVVDLTGYTHQMRPQVFAYRPASIAVNFLGYPGTSGADYFDYIIADSYVVPEPSRKFFAEKIAYLPDTYLVNDATREIDNRMPSRGEEGLPESGIVFCCFNNGYKFTPEMFDVWMRLLAKVEGSTIWCNVAHETAQRNLVREAEARGIAGSRLVFAKYVAAQEDHLSRLRLADLFLDTLPYNAHSTAVDALWAGVPVVTCSGESFASRVAGSLLTAVGMPELITHDLAAYEALALKLASDPALLAATKAKLAKNRSSYPLFDADRFRKHLEAAYTMMWERHKAGLAPETFAVPAAS